MLAVSRKATVYAFLCEDPWRQFSCCHAHATVQATGLSSNSLQAGTMARRCKALSMSVSNYLCIDSVRAVRPWRRQTEQFCEALAHYQRTGRLQITKEGAHQLHTCLYVHSWWKPASILLCHDKECTNLTTRKGVHIIANCGVCVMHRSLLWCTSLAPAVTENPGEARVASLQQ